MKQILKYFWKFLGITFLIEILWYVVCFSIGYFYFPGLMRHISMVGFLVIPFITSYHTMWKQIDELETYIEAEFFRKQQKTVKVKKAKPKVKANQSVIQPPSVKLGKDIIIDEKEELEETDVYDESPDTIIDKSSEEEF